MSSSFPVFMPSVFSVVVESSRTLESCSLVFHFSSLSMGIYIPFYFCCHAKISASFDSFLASPLPSRTFSALVVP